jgi:hypothetical protein
MRARKVHMTSGIGLRIEHHLDHPQVSGSTPAPTSRS